MFNMRASSFFIFFILTFVLYLYTGAATKTNLQKTKDNSNLEELESTANPIKLDSLSIPDLNNRPIPNILEYASTQKQDEKYLFFPSAGLYSGPTAKQDATTAITFGLYFNNLLDDYESVRFALALASSSDLFFNISKQFPLAPHTWGTPYWNINMNFAIDPNQPLASMVNMHNFTLGGAYGAKLNRYWSLEGNLGILNLKGIAISINTIYSLAL